MLREREREREERETARERDCSSLIIHEDPVNHVYNKMLLNENVFYLVLVAKQTLSETINYVY